MRAGSGVRALGVLVVALLAGAADASAQAARDDAAELVPGDHWSVETLRRLHGLGLVRDRLDPGQGRFTAAEVAAGLADALAALEPDSPLRRVLAGEAARFAEEFGRGPVGEERRPQLRGLVGGGIEARSGLLAPGTGYFHETWTGPAGIADRRAPIVVNRLSLSPAPAVAVALTVAGSYPAPALRELYVGVQRGRVGAWAGRRVERYGPGAGGNLVLAGEVPFDGAGASLRLPDALPGPLRLLGPIRVRSFVSRLDENGPVRGPWFWGARASGAPHERFGIAVSRAAVFGGDGAEPVTLRNVTYMLIGKHGSGGSGFENQVVAADAWYRPPLPGLPVTTYIEWGMEDSAGAWKNAPAFLVGAHLAAVPGAPALWLRGEWTSFARSCCGNPMWYRHHFFHGGWVAGAVPLGHRLGGHGREWALTAGATAADSRVRAAGTWLRTWRGEENLYAPDRAGVTQGGRLDLELRPRRHLGVRVGGVAEIGPAGRRSHHGLATLNLHF
jgi:hypothetical protein